MLESPRQFSFLTPTSPLPNNPLFVYLPGMDGTGQLFDRQLPGLAQLFDIRRLSVAVDDLSDWEHFTQKVADLVRQEIAQQPRDSVYLCGESFGGCLALKLLLFDPTLCDRLILINPASSLKRYPWIYWGSHLLCPLPNAIHRLTCVSFLPFLAAMERIEENDRIALLRAVQSVTQETSIWRLSLLRDFEVTEAELRRITQRTLIVAGEQDRLLPSVEEAKYLMRLLPHSQLHLLPHSGHACLLEKDVNLYEILRSAHFLPQSQPIADLSQVVSR